MTITANDLRWFRSERMTDFPDGGGQMTAVEILPGGKNQIFDDISDVDRAAGDVSIRKVFPAVASQNAEPYLDAGVVVMRQPADTAVDVTAFSTGDYYDERDDVKAVLESSILRGALYQGWLWGTHYDNQRVITLWQRTNAPLPVVGQRIELQEVLNGANVRSQILWVVRVSYSEVERTDSTGSYYINLVTLELAEGLNGQYSGTEPQRYDPSTTVTTGSKVYDTRYNPDALSMIGIRPLVEDVALGAYQAKVDSLYSPLIPTSFSESALEDVNPGGDTATLVQSSAGNVTIASIVNVMAPNTSWFLGTGVFPGTLSVAVSGYTTVVDSSGAMMSGTTQIGTIDYSNGIIRWNSSCPNRNGLTKTATFMPAAAPLRVASTASQAVTVENRGFVWVITLAPIPQPGSLRVSYRVNNVWYTLQDTGGGVLTGADSSYGIGTLNFSTGTVTLTTGAIPDPESDILYAWGVPTNYVSRGGSAVDPVKLSGQVTHGAIDPGSFTASWSTVELTDNGDGTLSGTGGTGTVNYDTGAWTIVPSVVPTMGTEITFDYDWGTLEEETFNAPSRDGEGKLLLTLAAVPVAGSIKVKWNTLLLDYTPAKWTTITRLIVNRVDPYVTAYDDGAGVLSIPSGTDGVVNYGAKTIHWLPETEVLIPKPIYANALVGSTVNTLTGLVTNTWRTLFDGFEYIPTGEYFPLDETGVVTVYYRQAGGDTSASEVYTVDSLNLDVTLGFSEQIAAGSLRFNLGNSVYTNTAGVIYRDPSPDTGAGSSCGVIDPISGRVQITSWLGGGANSVDLESLLTVIGNEPIDQAVFRTVSSPVKPQTFQLRFSDTLGNVYSKTPDGSGTLVDNDCTIYIDYSRGTVNVRFGQWKTVAELTSEETAEPWYDADAIIDIEGVPSIWVPLPVMADSILYNGVAYNMLPPDSELLGMDAARLPPDGKALILRVGMLALLHSTSYIPKASLLADEVIDCGRTRLYRVNISDVNGLRLMSDLFTVNRELGLVTMASSLDLAGYEAPYTIEHTIADLQRISATDINGTVTFLKPLSHDYDHTEDTYLSGMLYLGTQQARVTNKFEQASWTGVWSDQLIGSEPLASYNDVLYPIVVTNAGAYKDRFLIQFTSSTDFRVVGENMGQIATGDTGHDCSPVNPLTNQIIMTIPWQGWGGGWAVGNCVRLNMEASCYPVDAIRAIQPSDPTGLLDNVEFLLIGNVDA